MNQADDYPLNSREAERSPYFGTTQWTVVVAAAQGPSPEADKALETLCHRYWYPLYAFVRRRGHSPQESEDLTQSFFAFLINCGTIARADKLKGKFRSFLLAAFTNFLNNEHDRQRALKRGGGSKIISWDEIKAEERYRHEPMDSHTPEQLFERRWAYTLLEQVFENLRQEYATGQKSEVFEQLQPFLTGPPEEGALSKVSATLKMTVGAVNVALHRLRRRFGESLRAEISNTVSDPKEIDSEIRYLFLAIGSAS